MAVLGGGTWYGGMSLVGVVGAAVCPPSPAHRAVWSHRVYGMLYTEKPPSFTIMGPFGSPSVQYHRYQHVVLLAGGVGVTPIAAVANELRDMYFKPGAGEWLIHDYGCINMFLPDYLIG